MSGDPLWSLLAAVFAGLLAVIAALPTPANRRSFRSVVLGGVIAATIARARQWPRVEVQDARLEAAYWGTAVAIMTYLIGVVAGV